jgi:PleD family two-component response regulator
MHLLRSHVLAPQSSRAGKGTRAPRTFGKASGEAERAEHVSPRESVRLVVLEELQKTIADKSPARILLVDADPSALRRVGARLSDQGYGVTAASSFEAAKKRFEAVNPELVVAAVRLAAFNGLHLAAWLRFHHPNLPIIITHTAHDIVLEADAQRLGATFVVQPLENPEFWQSIRLAVGDPRLHEGPSAMPRSSGA